MRNNVVTLGAFYRKRDKAQLATDEMPINDHQGEPRIIDTSSLAMQQLKASAIREAQRRMTDDATLMAAAGSSDLVINFLKNLTRHFAERMQS